MTVDDLKEKRDLLIMVPGKEKDLTEAVYNIGIAIVERLDKFEKVIDKIKDKSVFDHVFGKRK